jgi:hypothetical protein
MERAELALDLVNPGLAVSLDCLFDPVLDLRRGFVWGHLYDELDRPPKRTGGQLAMDLIDP